MEISHLTLDAAWRPSFLMKADYLRAHLYYTSPQQPTPWEKSHLNPKNLTESLDIKSCRWRVDGATKFGTCLYIVPLNLQSNVPPLRIFLYLPDQTDWPPALRESLDASESVVLRDGRAIAGLGIVKHVCRALDHYCLKNPQFEQSLNPRFKWSHPNLTPERKYLKLPFGSAIHFENITADIRHMVPTFIPGYEAEANTLTMKVLQEKWQDVPMHAWPPVVDILNLKLQQQLNETVSTVTASTASLTSDIVFIFKSGLDSMDHIYHELHFLLTIPSHPNLMPPPLAIVTKKVSFGGKMGVVGFLLPFFSRGSIRDTVPSLHKRGLLTHEVRLRWCRQVTSAMIWIQEKGGTFYSDLRPDNILVDDSENAILCDFEQRGNWPEWSPPEIRYRQYAENIRFCLSDDLEGDRFRHLLERYTRTFHDLSHLPSDESEQAFVYAKNRPWFALPPVLQERAMVSCLGLLIYTIFEGLSNVRHSIACKWPHEPEFEFPEFRSTPHSLRRIIRACTADAPEWNVLHQGESQTGNLTQIDRPFRKDSLLYPAGGISPILGGGERRDAALEGISDYWTAEVERVEAFLGREDWQAGLYGKDRPSLRELLEALSNVSTENTLK